MKVVLLLLGAKGYAVLRALADNGAIDIAHCVIGADAGVEDDCSGAIADFCHKRGLPHVAREKADLSALATGVDHIVAVGWRWLVVDDLASRLIVFHDSLLPRYRGFAPLVNAMLNREPEVGVTALRATSQYDRGNVLMQKRMPLRYPARIGDVIDVIAGLYSDLAVEVLSGLAAGTLSASGVPQDESKASYSLWRDDDDYRIDWSQSADEIAHFVACVGYPYKGASAMLRGGIVRVYAATPQPDVRIENRVAGKVIFMEADGPVVVCGVGLLKLTDIRDLHGTSLLPLKSFRSRFE